MEFVAGLVFIITAFLLVVFLAGDTDRCLKEGALKKNPELTLKKALGYLFVFSKRRESKISLISFIAQIVNYLAFLFGVVGCVILKLSGGEALFFIGFLIMVILFLAMTAFYITVRFLLRKKRFAAEMEKAREADAANEAKAKAESGEAGAAAETEDKDAEKTEK